MVHYAGEFDTLTGKRIKPALWDALAAVGCNKPGQIDPGKLGLWLRGNVNRVVGHHKLLVDRETNKAVPRWRLEQSEQSS